MAKYTRDQMVEKVQKILEIAKRSMYEGEAQTAYQMAQKLMMEYNLSELEVQQAAEEAGIKSTVTKEKVDAATKGTMWKSRLARTIAENFRCMAYFRYDWSSRKKEPDTIIMFLGREDDIQVATEIYRVAIFTIEKFSKRFRADRRKELREEGSYWGKEGSRAANLSWIDGFVDGVAAKFHEMKEAMVQENSRYALVVVIPDDVKQVAMEMGIVTRPRTDEELEKARLEAEERNRVHEHRMATDPKYRKEYEKRMQKYYKPTKIKKSQMFDPDAYERGKKKGKEFDGQPKTKLPE